MATLTANAMHEKPMVYSIPHRPSYNIAIALHQSFLGDRIA
ncbi:hypothetical protein [Nostoc sp.]